MNPPEWNPIGWMTQEAAESFTEQSLPRQLKKCCGVQNDGFVCTLFEGHTDDHEAWGLGHILHYQWHNCAATKRH